MRCTLLPILLSPTNGMLCACSSGGSSQCRDWENWGVQEPGRWWPAAKAGCPDLVGGSLLRAARVVGGGRASPGAGGSGGGRMGQGGGWGCRCGTYPATPWSGTLRKSMFCSDGGRVLGWRLALRGGSAAAGGPRVCFWGAV